MNIKKWFLDKEFTANEQYLMSVSNMETMKVTDKAIQISFNNDISSFTKWIPKSCLMTREETEAADRAEESRMEKASSGFEELKAFAASKGIAVRSNSTRKTIQKKLQEVGAYAEAYELGLIKR